MITRSTLLAGELRWLLTLTIAGRIHRYSTRTISVADDTRSRLYLAGLTPPDYLDAIAPPGEVASEPSLQVELTLARDTSAGLTALALADLDLGDATAELALHLVGDDLAARRVVLQGPLETTEIGTPGEPVRLGITGAPWRASTALLLSETAVVSTATWTLAARKIGDGVDGQYYPEVVGAPGHLAPDVGGTYPGAPALLVEIDSATLDNSVNPCKVLLGAGAMKAAGVASVKIKNATTGLVSAALTPVVEADDRGQSVTLVSVAVGSLAIADGDELYAHYIYPATGGRPDNQGGSLRSADEVIRWLLDRSGARVDTGSLRAALLCVRGFYLDFYLNEQVDPIDLLLDAVLPLLPLAMIYGPLGIGFRRWPYDATAAQRLARLDIDSYTEGTRLGPARRSSPGDVVNLLQIDFAPDAETGSPRGRFVFAPTKRYDQTAREVHPLARASATRYGEQGGEAIDGRLVVVEETAVKVVAWQMALRSSTRTSATYALGQEWQAMEPGDVVTMTDAEIGWSEQVCVIRSILRREGPTELVLEAIPQITAG